MYFFIKLINQPHRLSSMKRKLMLKATTPTTVSINCITMLINRFRIDSFFFVTIGDYI